MTAKFREYFKKLEPLSVEELDRRAREFCRVEKQNVALVIAHIAKIAEKKGHALLGFQSLFDHCVKRLKLSEGSVYRRLQVAGKSREFPQLCDALFENRLTLTVASILAPHLSQQNVDTLLAQAEGMSRREAEELAARLRPKEAFTSFRRRVRRAKRGPETPAAEGASRVSERGVPAGEDREVEKRGAHAGDPRPIFEPATEARYNYRFSAGSDFTGKLERFAEVVGVKYPHRHLEEILEKTLEIALEKKDPMRKLERRRRREAKKEEKEVTLEGSRGSAQEATTGPAKSRYISSEVRERVLERAGCQCEYRGPDGTRCTSRTGLEVEHTQPFAVYRSHDERTLRAYCEMHNRVAAEAYYGPEYIERKIEERPKMG